MNKQKLYFHSFLIAVALYSISGIGVVNAQSYSRTETITYHDNMTKWVLGQASKTTANGVVTTDTTYSANAQPLTTKAFGKLQQTLTYNTDGTVATVKDGNNNVTTLSSWYRGIPRSIRYPGGSTQSAVVSAAGWLTRVTDENGFATNYTYDAMGRLASIAYPTGDSTAWSTTTQVFQPVASAEYGIPAGHWRQTVITGTGRKISYFDALWRPLLVREYDTANEAGTQRFQRFTYDHAGRTTFASYPSAASSPTTGTWREYDALGRATSVSQDSELGLLTTTTAYLSGFRTRVTSPKGAQTTTAYLAWDQPTTDYPVTITHPGGAWTHITRDGFGKPTQLRRSNSSSPTGGTVAVNRRYAYDANQQLCRVLDPETGATLMGYDGAGNLAWSASGLSTSTACHATGLVAPIQQHRIGRTYDARNRLLTLTFPDGLGNQAWTYTPDGLPASITTQNATDSSVPVVNAYSYNRRRLMVGESMSLAGSTPWAIGYGYNGNGHLASLVYPSSLTVAYAPNALGQPTQVGTFANGATYFPNGALKQFTYGNGIVHTQAQNARGLPTRRIDCAVAGTCATANRRLDLQYTYDRHGNVQQIVDHVNGRQTRGMSYDTLDRLIQTTSNMFGTASYAYDVLDNLSTVHASSGSHARNHTYVYDTGNRLSQVRQTVGGAAVASLAYDIRGNLRTKGAQGYEFDFGNRLRAATGKETYHYDGHGRRIRARTNSTSYITSQYANSGQLLYQQNYRQAKRSEYMYLGDSLVAFRETPHGSTASTVKYQHTDALSTPIAVTNAAKATIETSEYEPYGQLVNKAAFDGPGFTGHVQDAATGLTYMQQRYYDPQLGVFLSVDAVTASSNPVSQFHRYRYAGSNPYIFIDPDGREQTFKLNYIRENGTPTAAQQAEVLMSLACACDAGYVAPTGSGAVQGSVTPFETAVGSGATRAAALVGQAANAVRGLISRSSASGIANPVPATMARVIPEGVPATSLGPPGVADVFVTAADDIAGMNAAQIAGRLTIPQSNSGFRVIEFASPGPGVASPVFRSNPGFVGGGRTAGGAREFVVPNQRIPSDARQRIVE
ncbi:polymorphic toxin type 10 domain-containing protein [Luteimonas sp. 3794]|uniref:polymorphic toxin type 10 domain-containing protein n=1 Tax=Luteimonas sp. 3794 TaxID=2817730 RepID=UPI00285A9FC1|nr:polymorphic toxin type 10 domain-containing protein [Luteimonas sp. 3794]MDR6990217.1 RHS repeat-associated protein [Luteimonas sp. 3794]